MELRQLRYALSVAKERNFTRAARRLNISQSAVSEQVSLLEEEIGFSLFRRTPRGIEITERGRTFLYEAERVIGDVLSLSDAARRLRGAPSDTLMIGMGSGMAQIFMPRLFGGLKAIFPACGWKSSPRRPGTSSTTCTKSASTPASRSNPIPSGCRPDSSSSGWRGRDGADRPSQARLARSKPVDIGRLVGEPIIMSELTVGYGQVVLALFADLGIRPNILAVADNIETMKVIVQSGTGIAIVPRACAANEAALGVLKVLPIAPARTVTLSLFRRRQPLSRRKEAARSCGSC